MKKAPMYVIHKHAATHLHYDLRLEIEGVLRSWAVPKEPSTEEGVKRLAVAVEDHELGYADFEGAIPKGQYGAGRVDIWDKGSFEILEKTRHKIIIDIRGERLKGIFCLIKLKANVESDKNWLFFKKTSAL
jgi:DNA ligase D-like protein (predicted 3'-phosphoesterase)